jgi:hypothetical protein
MFRFTTIYRTVPPVNLKYYKVAARYVSSKQGVWRLGIIDGLLTQDLMIVEESKPSVQGCATVVHPRIIDYLPLLCHAYVGITNQAIVAKDLSPPSNHI